ncbi:MAG TPA: methylenetetrahydrofolate reductase [Solirubrobacteraceae bacterium]|nr:methylenetetrahydrofolate reductase [Solirubrobacteraceae bacterium]
MTKLREALAAGDFVVTAELGPPLQPDPARVRETARAFAPIVHAANVTDNQAATVKCSPLASSVWMLEQGLDPILQVTTRDRNMLALQSDLLGAWALGVRSVLALSGDPLKVGPYEGLSKPVGDLDSAGLLELIARMNEGTLAAGEAIDPPTDFLILTAANPLVDTVERLERKLHAGAQAFQTNIVYDVERFLVWLEPVLAAGVTERGPMIVGVTPPRSTRMLQHMHDHIPGIEVDDATFARMAGLEGAEARAAGIAIAVDVVARLREIPQVAGVHLMAPGWEAEAVPALVAGAGLAPLTTR